MHLQAKRDQPRREARHSLLKVERKESAAHLLVFPSLRELKKKHGLETLKDGELFFSAQLASFLKELFKLGSPSAPTPDEPKLRPARAVKRHRSPTELDTTYLPLRQRSGFWRALQDACESVSEKPTRHPRQSASMFRCVKRGWDLGCVQRPLPVCVVKGAAASPAKPKQNKRVMNKKKYGNEVLWILIAQGLPVAIWSHSPASGRKTQPLCLRRQSVLSRIGPSTFN
ncbi:hypothetical protein TRVL_09285 [Trypanosoma vivax]|nr:hypothetical protein TRVL_09285 [Trypanosoma vivax]